jgi:catechol 2,3-dioxygenase-like lactoylglutathione lyase family enzyme
MKIEALDHVVLTVRDVRATGEFYARVLGMDARIYEDADKTFHFGQLHFGNQKINLHEADHEFEPKALHPTPGSGDLCFITTSSPDEVLQHLLDCGVEVVEGPVPRTGARGPMTSIYLRDPDQNLVEITHYDG